MPQASSLTTGPRQVNSGMGNYFEALRDSKDRTPIPSLALDFRAVVRSLNRERLAGLGRYLYDNYGQVGYAVNQIANYSVPIIPQAASANPEWNKLADAWWTEWCKRADFTGRFHFNTLQRLACKAIDTDGDIAVLPTLEAGFPQIQMVEGWRIGARKIQDKNILDGVRVDNKGRVLGYYLDEPNGPVPVSVNEMLLLFDADRYSSYRGLSPLRRGSNDIRDAQDIKAFEKLAVKIGSALAAVLEVDGPIEEDVWGNDTAENGNAPPADATPQEKKLSLAELLGGDIPTLPTGTKLHQLENKRPGERVNDFLLFLVGSFVLGLDIPPAFFLDEKLTGPNQRAVNGKAQRKFDQRQDMIAAMVEWVWLRIIGWAVANGELQSVDGWWHIEWQGPPKISIDEGRDAAHWREDVGNGLMTRHTRYANEGKDWQRETDQSFAENDYIITRAKEIASRHDLPVETILSRYGFQAAKPAQAPNTDNPDETRDE